MDNAVREADGGPDRQHQNHREHAEIVVVHTVEDRERKDHGGEREDSLDRQVDRPHQDDESFAEAEDKGNCGVLADPDEVSEGKKVMVDGGDDQAQKDKHHRRRPGGRRRRPHLASALATGATFRVALTASPSAIAVSLGKDAGAQTERARFSGQFASCTGSVRSRAPKCRSNRVWAPP